MPKYSMKKAIQRLLDIYYAVFLIFKSSHTATSWFVKKRSHLHDRRDGKERHGWSVHALQKYSKRVQNRSFYFTAWFVYATVLSTIKY